MPQTGPRTRASDATLEKAEDVARAALLEHVAADEVGVHLGCFVEAERVVTHTFSCERAGYRGWRWSVTVARASRQRTVTVDEVVLIPGEEAIVAPAWVPWRDRVRPGDLSPGDLLPVDDDDPRLVPTWSFGDDPVEELLDEDERDQVRRVSRELGLGRVRTLSVEGRDQATQRWYAGVGGPHAAVAKAAPSDCMSCGFLVRLAGPLSETFGVCANANANDDGRVVSLDHGCGAHSEAQVARRNLPAPLPDPVVDELTLEDLERF
ncbi:DUF3027 domain-containing protein [Nocardioides imazamoxiresistens]|uniref:DUF3027 domain-containing protein n=1 Tax=Nocardioides imazamoxiresistens TaxID=3231893 RepID=UPI003F68B6CE